ncbi:DUF4181 domain-containing protein [Solibacillus sp. FSL K6-1554]|uniref:DUF4181 domain-containing protein n=1 Tax=Solibacillus sp. FSL K6-1554 TaxID=2921472 RepID=UPI0007FB426B|nr:DUF4181 domain-containing protein [Solibacillus silvestris]OBW60242.1 hypothetical protein A9986_03445 [Solibacillus silvestris]
MENVLTNLILISSIFGLVLFFMNKSLRKWLNVEKKEFFSNHFVNEKHKKIDRTIRISFIVLILYVFFINVSGNPLKHIWFLQPYILLFGLVIVTELVRIVMEKRYSKNKNDYIFTSVQLVVISLFLLAVFSTDFFGLLAW